MRRVRGRGWALLPVASIVGVIAAIRYASATADWLTYLALVAVPILAALTLGWVARGARPWLALLVPGLFVVAWRTPDSLTGEAAAALLSALSCVTLGALLSAITPDRWLKLGIIAMAGADAWLIATSQLQAPNNELVAARPGGGLPQLQSEQFGSVTLGYGDLFVAGLLGGVFSARRRVQRAAAALTLVLAALFDLLFLYFDNLPATVPVALALCAVELGLARGRRRRQRTAGTDRVSGCCDRSRREDGIPPPAT